MSSRTIEITEPLHAYLLSVAVREPEILARLRAETEPMEMSQMQISPEQGALMALLVELIGARKCIEVGVYTGYSALRVASAMGPEGRLIACDVNQSWTDVGKRYWREAGVEDKIDLRLAPAADTLDSLVAAGESGTFDFAFIDADKASYDTYYERCLTLLRPGGLIAIDNVLWQGKVADPAFDDADTLAIRALNDKLTGDSRVSLCMVPIGDGLTLARKRH
jgi:predicted O-methyltransferase YrrM